MSLICELSGESIIPTETGMMSTSSTGNTNGNQTHLNITYVVTPSGHVCRRDLLQQTLRDNGGYDPFDLQRPLRDDELIVLQQSQSSVARLLPPSTSSAITSSGNITATLQQLQKQYDNLLLELYDTKKLLHQTQEELSLALYQNDAAVRVIARLRMEQDQIAATTAAVQQQQQQQQMQDRNSNPATTNGTVPPSTTQPPPQEGVEMDQPISKKMKLTSSQQEETILLNQIPDADHNCMIQTWNTLNASRKSMQKMALVVANALKWTDTSQKSVHVLELNGLGSNTTSSNAVVASSDYTVFLKRYDSVSSNDDEHTIMMVQVVSKLSVAESFYQMYAYTKEEETLKYMTKHLNHHTSQDPDKRNSNFVMDLSCCALDVVVPSSPPPSNERGNDTNDHPSAIMTMILYSTTRNEYSVALYESHPTLGKFNQCIVGQYTLPDQVVGGGNSGNSTMKFVDLRLHPDGQHIIVTTQDKNIYLMRYVKKNEDASTNDHRHHNEKYYLSIITQFSMNKDIETQGNILNVYSAATLHPDGLIYVTATSGTGDIILWDLKSQQMAGTLAYPSDPAATTTTRRDVSSMQFSNNGYHLAVAYKESGLIHVWDLRKQSILATLNGSDDKDRIEEVLSVQFDDSGKYLAYSGNNLNNGSGNSELIVAVTTAKIWDRTTTFRMSNMEATKNGLIWNKDLKFIAVSAVQKDSNNEMTPKVAIFDLV